MHAFVLSFFPFRQHRNLVLLRKGEIIGGSCFRPFHSQFFVEIVFLAITMNEQTKVHSFGLFLSPLLCCGLTISRVCLSVCSFSFRCC